jgi:hypothetical protein
VTRDSCHVVGHRFIFFALSQQRSSARIATGVNLTPRQPRQPRHVIGRSICDVFLIERVACEKWFDIHVVQAAGQGDHVADSAWAVVIQVMCDV